MLPKRMKSWMLGAKNFISSKSATWKSAWSSESKPSIDLVSSRQTFDCEFFAFRFQRKCDELEIMNQKFAAHFDQMDSDRKEICDYLRKSLQQRGAFVTIVLCFRHGSRIECLRICSCNFNCRLHCLIIARALSQDGVSFPCSIHRAIPYFLKVHNATLVSLSESNNWKFLCGPSFNSELVSYKEALFLGFLYCIRNKRVWFYSSHAPQALLGAR